MSKVGIIAEFNPLHSGHRYLLSQAKQLGTVVCAISGNFVQRGDTAICEKRIRAQMCLNASADAVIEIPVLWSMSTAQNFALGGVSALLFAGCDTLMFGSECGDVAVLEKAAHILQSNEFANSLEKHLEKGITFAAARQAAAEECGCPKGILAGANNNLAIEYIIAAKKLGANLKFKTVKRQGAAHDSCDVLEHVSASLLRERLIAGDMEFCQKYIQRDDLKLLKSQCISDIKNIELAILAALRLKPKADFQNLPDLSEGVENKLYSAIRLATDLEELYNEIKVKRYTMARIRRLVLSAVLGFDNELFMKPLPYIRVLGFNKTGEALIREICTNPRVPVILRANQIENLSPQAKKVFESECKATDLFALSLKNPLACGIEYTSKLIKEK